MGYALTSKGQVTIPKVWRDKLGLRAGDRVTFAANDSGELTLRAVPSIQIDFVQRLARAKDDFAPNFTTEGKDGVDYIKCLRGE